MEVVEQVEFWIGAGIIGVIMVLIGIFGKWKPVDFMGRLFMLIMGLILMILGFGIATTL